MDDETRTTHCDSDSLDWWPDPEKVEFAATVARDLGQELVHEGKTFTQGRDEQHLWELTCHLRRSLLYILQETPPDSLFEAPSNRGLRISGVDMLDRPSVAAVALHDKMHCELARSALSGRMLVEEPESFAGDDEEIGEPYWADEVTKLNFLVPAKAPISRCTDTTIPLIDDAYRANIGEALIQVAGELDEVARLARNGGENADANAASDMPPAFRLADQQYKIGEGDPFSLTEAQDHVLRSLIDLGGSADKRALVNQSGKDDSPRVLRAIIDQHPSLAGYITLPGKKGKGGYRTSIREPDTSPPKRHQSTP